MRSREMTESCFSAGADATDNVTPENIRKSRSNGVRFTLTSHDMVGKCARLFLPGMIEDPRDGIFNRLDRNDLKAFLHLGRDIRKVLDVFLRNENGLDPVTLCGEELFVEAADG